VRPVPQSAAVAQLEGEGAQAPPMHEKPLPQSPAVAQFEGSGAQAPRMHEAPAGQNALLPHAGPSLEPRLAHVPVVAPLLPSRQTSPGPQGMLALFAHAAPS
jgi:hypothetical protein